MGVVGSKKSRLINIQLGWKVKLGGSTATTISIESEHTACYTVKEA